MGYKYVSSLNMYTHVCIMGYVVKTHEIRCSV